ncbi:hypothetical protein BKA65DRAFT_534204 [Rhexocercosporidium sp. MPI-PUGE-AT-0058]|nr:hypothetical protein BKA65DRAFT_534204 [Rhexocercosporidium sp. MPI-PUGE-AT-0058]
MGMFRDCREGRLKFEDKTWPWVWGVSAALFLSFHHERLFDVDGIGRAIWISEKRSSSYAHTKSRKKHARKQASKQAGRQAGRERKLDAESMELKWNVSLAALQTMESVAGSIHSGRRGKVESSRIDGRSVVRSVQCAVRTRSRTRRLKVGGCGERRGEEEEAEEEEKVVKLKVKEGPDFKTGRQVGRQAGWPAKAGQSSRPGSGAEQTSPGQEGRRGEGRKREGEERRREEWRGVERGGTGNCNGGEGTEGGKNPALPCPGLAGMPCLAARDGCDWFKAAVHAGQTDRLTTFLDETSIWADHMSGHITTKLLPICPSPIHVSPRLIQSIQSNSGLTLLSSHQSYPGGPQTAVSVISAKVAFNIHHYLPRWIIAGLQPHPDREAVIYSATFPIGLDQQELPRISSQCPLMAMVERGILARQEQEMQASKMRMRQVKKELLGIRQENCTG